MTTTLATQPAAKTKTELQIGGNGRNNDAAASLSNLAGRKGEPIPALAGGEKAGTSALEKETHMLECIRRALALKADGDKWLSNVRDAIEIISGKHYMCPEIQYREQQSIGYWLSNAVRSYKKAAELLEEIAPLTTRELLASIEKVQQEVSQLPKIPKPYYTSGGDLEDYGHNW
ncbi:Uncharacterised protein [Candidatus Anstonella stagnisolia]|nr:Uncharacterised protein [Candidatus Anstonella stagnisolia]